MVTYILIHNIGLGFQFQTTIKFVGYLFLKITMIFRGGFELPSLAFAAGNNSTNYTISGKI